MKKKLITKKEFKKKLTEKIEKVIVLASVLILAYFILCYIDVIAKNVTQNLELANWSILHDYKISERNW